MRWGVGRDVEYGRGDGMWDLMEYEIWDVVWNGMGCMEIDGIWNTVEYGVGWNTEWGAIWNSKLDGMWDFMAY